MTVVDTLGPMSNLLKEMLELRERIIINIVPGMDSRLESASEKDSIVRESTVILIIEGEGSKTGYIVTN